MTILSDLYDICEYCNVEIEKELMWEHIAKYHELETRKYDDPPDFDDTYDVDDSVEPYEDDGPAGDYLNDYWFNAEGPDEPAGLDEEYDRYE